jgi:hypothetical protein
MRNGILLFFPHLRVPSIREREELFNMEDTHVRPVPSTSKTGSQPKTGGPLAGTIVPSVRPSKRIGSESVQASISHGKRNRIDSWSYEGLRRKRRCIKPRLLAFESHQEDGSDLEAIEIKNGNGLESRRRATCRRVRLPEENT